MDASLGSSSRHLHLERLLDQPLGPSVLRKLVSGGHQQ